VRGARAVRRSLLGVLHSAMLTVCVHRAERAKEHTKEGIRDLKNGIKGLFRGKEHKGQDKSEITASKDAGPVLACRLPPSENASDPSADPSD